MAGAIEEAGDFNSRQRIHALRSVLLDSADATAITDGELRPLLGCRTESGAWKEGSTAVCAGRQLAKRQTGTEWAHARTRRAGTEDALSALLRSRRGEYRDRLYGQGKRSLLQPACFSVPHRCEAQARSAPTDVHPPYLGLWRNAIWWFAANKDLADVSCFFRCHSGFGTHNDIFVLVGEQWDLKWK